MDSVNSIQIIFFFRIGLLNEYIYIIYIIYTIINNIDTRVVDFFGFFKTIKINNPCLI